MPQYPVELRVEAGAVESLRQSMRWGRIQHVSPPDDVGWQDVGVIYELFEYALTSVLGMGERVEVIGPAELREAVVVAHRRALARYEVVDVVESYGCDTMTRIR